MAQKEIKDLDLKDAFLFAAALEDPKTCQMVLELVSCMIRDGLVEEIPRLKADEAFCKSMLETYHLA